MLLSVAILLSLIQECVTFRPEWFGRATQLATRQYERAPLTQCIIEEAFTQITPSSVYNSSNVDYFYSLVDTHERADVSPLEVVYNFNASAANSLVNEVLLANLHTKNHSGLVYWYELFMSEVINHCFIHHLFFSHNRGKYFANDAKAVLSVRKPFGSERIILINLTS